MSNDDELSLLLFHEGCDGIHPRPDDRGALSGLIIFTLHSLLSTGCEASLLLLLCLWTVTIQQAEQLCG